MTALIGSEYLMAYGLLRALREGRDSVSFSELRDMAKILQSALNEAGADAVACTDFERALAEWNRYFEEAESCGIPCVKCAQGTGARDLKRRFVGYLPLDVLRIVLETCL